MAEAGRAVKRIPLVRARLGLRVEANQESLTFSGSEPMKKIQDNFSKQSVAYQKFRPTYPQELFDLIFSRCREHKVAWDCGTGNGQVAIELAKQFSTVWASDISQAQISKAPAKENVHYLIERAEKTSIPDKSVDLITVAQAIHWFDIPAFRREVKRVLRPNGIIAFWGYGLIRVDLPINRIIDSFYTEVLGPYWDKERKHIDDGYQAISQGFGQMQCFTNLSIRLGWTLGQMQGYLGSWSAVQAFKEQNQGEDPVMPVIQRLKGIWAEQQQISFPLFLRIGSLQ